VPNRFYTPFQIALAAFFGTLLAGLLCLALNYRQLENIRYFKVTLFLTLMIVPTSIAAYIQIPDTAYDRLWPLGTAVIMWIVAYVLQARQIESALTEGAIRKSILNLVGIIVFSLLLLVIGLVISMKLFGLNLPI